MKSYCVGIDIGATKSHFALFDTEGNFVDLGRWGCLNYEVMPGLYAQFEEEFRQFTAQVLSRNKITMEQISCSVLGVGGVDTKLQHGIISGILKKIGLRNFILVNDAYLGIPAGSRAGTGICAINGSGCTLAGITKENKMMQIGGVGAVSADMGGGTTLGNRVVSAVYSELFRKGEPTIMTPLLFRELGITSKYDYVEKIYEKSEEGTFSMSICGRLVFEAVNQNDRLASQILNEIADNYANGISCMIEELSFPPEDELCIVFAGSVFVKGEHPLLIDSLKAKVTNDNPAYRFDFKKLDVPNVAGAVIWALNTVNDKGAYYEKIRGQLRDLK